MHSWEAKKKELQQKSQENRESPRGRTPYLAGVCCGLLFPEGRKLREQLIAQKWDGVSPAYWGNPSQQ